MPYKDKEVQREYQRQWMARRRAEYFDGKVCVRCGSTDDLQLDHIDSNLKVSHRIWSWNKIRREEEIVKCQILCVFCHYVKSKDSGDNLGQAKIDKEIAEEIRSMYCTGLYLQKDLGTFYGISQREVSHITCGDYW